MTEVGDDVTRALLLRNNSSGKNRNTSSCPCACTNGLHGGGGVYAMAHCGRAGLKRGVNPSQGAMPFTWPCPPARSPFASVAAVEAGLLPAAARGGLPTDSIMPTALA